MIDLYTWPTVNGLKVTIMLEETDLPYNVIPVDLYKGDQFSSAFLRISPNNKIPAIVDHEGPDGLPYSLFESGAILIYLAEKTGRFLPSGGRQKYEVVQWLMFQISSIGPMQGQATHFRRYAPQKIDYAINRYVNEITKLYGVMNRRLEESAFLAGEYSVADIACIPWIRAYERQGYRLSDFPNIERWFRAACERPAVRRGLEILADRRRELKELDAGETRSILFGERQYRQR